MRLAQLKRLDEILKRRPQLEQLYNTRMQSFEGIKPPYVGPDVTEVNWLVYLVYLGTRFTRSGRDAIIDDLRGARIESTAYSQPLHLQRHYFDVAYRRGDLLVAEKNSRPCSGASVFTPISRTSRSSVPSRPWKMRRSTWERVQRVAEMLVIHDTEQRGVNCDERGVSPRQR